MTPNRGDALPLLREIIETDRAAHPTDGLFEDAVPMWIAVGPDVPTGLMRVKIPKDDPDHVIITVVNLLHGNDNGSVTSREGLDEVIALLTRVRERMDRAGILNA